MNFQTLLIQIAVDLAVDETEVVAVPEVPSEVVVILDVRPEVMVVPEVPSEVVADPGILPEAVVE